jgi:hypothetical protein
MSDAISTDVQGYAELQAALDKVAAAVKPSGALGEGVKRTTQRLYKHAIGITHVDTGTLASSHRWQYAEESGSPRGVVFVEDSLRNPKSKQAVGRYAPIEEGRGGQHAFYARTVAEEGDAAAGEGINVVLEALP